MKQTRIHKSPLSEGERKAIDWLLPKLPASMTPDQLTALGVFGAVLTMAGYIGSWLSPYMLWLASFGLVLHWFGDSLDGNLARYRKVERPRYGYFLDQTIDVVSNFMIGVGMGLSPFVHLNVALIALCGYHMISIYVFVRAYLGGDFLVTVMNSGPTEIRVLLIIMNTLIFAFGAPVWTIAGVAFTWCDITVSLFGAGFMAAFLYLIFSFAPTLRDADDADRAARRAAAPSNS